MANHRLSERLRIRMDEIESVPQRRASTMIAGCDVFADALTGIKLNRVWSDHLNSRVTTCFIFFNHHRVSVLTQRFDYPQNGFGKFQCPWFQISTGDGDSDGAGAIHLERELALPTATTVSVPSSMWLLKVTRWLPWRSHRGVP